MNETTTDPSAEERTAAQEHGQDGPAAEAAASGTEAPETSATQPAATAEPADDTADDDDAADGTADDAAAQPAGPGSEGADSESEDEADGSESAEERVRRLEEEGDVAADYLEELLDIADLDGDIDIDVEGDRASVEIRGADRLAELNRPKGELLDALQELARLAVQTRTGTRSRLMLDIGGFRAEHKGSLEELAATAIAEAKESGQPVPMRPMNPFERKVVHDVAKREGLRSESDGDGKGRHVVIYPAS
jgi:spoIIIJ-associated protein